jgi:hypothetical protein
MVVSDSMRQITYYVVEAHTLTDAFTTLGTYREACNLREAKKLGIWNRIDKRNVIAIFDSSGAPISYKKLGVPWRDFHTTYSSIQRSTS